VTSEHTRLNLDLLQAKQATKNLEDAKDGLRRMIRENLQMVVSANARSTTWKRFYQTLNGKILHSMRTHKICPKRNGTYIGRK
jgi:hypothetical protein